MNLPTDEEHAAAIASTHCPICGADAGAECVFGPLRPAHERETFPGRAHLRRVNVWRRGGPPASP